MYALQHESVRSVLRSQIKQLVDEAHAVFLHFASERLFFLHFILVFNFFDGLKEITLHFL